MSGAKVVRFSNHTRPARTAGLIIPAWGALLVSLLSDGYAIQSERSEERGRPPASWQR